MITKEQYRKLIAELNVCKDKRTFQRKSRIEQPTRHYTHDWKRVTVAI